MRLDRLLEHVAVRELRGDAATADVVAVVHASDAVVPGAMFCCVRGERADGHAFAAAAVEAGAVALLCERPVVDAATVPQVIVDDVRSAMAMAAAALHGHPARRLLMLGVTGTNGKTTTVHLLASVLRANGTIVEQIGTLHPAAAPGGPPNTPDATVLQGLLADLVARGVAAVAMEVSSHALAHHRVDGITYRVAGFTNLTQDHLDFHGTMDRYFRAKARLFTPGLAEAGVVNADDEWGRRLLAEASIPLTAYSLADAGDLDLGLTACTFFWRGHRIRLALGGRFNVANALCAATMASVAGLDDQVIAAGLEGAGPVPGRFEPVDAGQDFTVVVDYAHTPDGLEQVLTTARAAAAGGRVLAVFGCGGDKDRGKRPLMGAIAERLADEVFLTSDNPRGEDPDAIIAEVLAGIHHPGEVHVQPDRRAAIRAALAAARAGDVVVIAGKGHETGQEVAGQVLPFDDRIVARQLLGGAR